MNKMATASLQTSGSMFTNSRCPPRSQMENVIVVRRTEIVFSIKLTPSGQMPLISMRDTRTHKRRTQRLYIILIKTSLNVFDH